MSISFTGRIGDGNPNHILEVLERMIQALSADHDIHIGTEPPLGPWEKGDFWYNPEKNRYYAYVEET